MLDIVITGNNLNYCTNLTNYLCMQNVNIRIQAIYNNVEELFAFFEKNMADVVLLDIDQIDYNNVLKKDIIKRHLHTFIIVSNNHEVGKELQDFDIYGFIYNKDNYKNIANLVNQLYSSKLVEEYYCVKQNSNTRKIIIDKIERELKYLNVQASYIGVKYLIEATYILYNLDDFYDYNLEKDIYPIVAQKYHKNVNNIKSNINYAVNILYVECEEAKLKNYIEEYSLYKPSPKRFMAAIVKKIKDDSLIFE